MYIKINYHVACLISIVSVKTHRTIIDIAIAAAFNFSAHNVVLGRVGLRTTPSFSIGISQSYATIVHSVLIAVIK